MKTIYPNKRMTGNLIKRENIAIQLEEKMPRSDRKRCQAVKMEASRQVQCRKAAKEDFDKCAEHSNGYIAEIYNGKREGDAGKKDPGYLKELFLSKPEIQALYDQQLNSPSILDYREEIALAKTLLRVFLQNADMEDTNTTNGRVPHALAAIDRLERVLSVGERALKIEEKLGAITREELRYYFKCVAETLDRFVDSSRHDEARIYLARRLREANLSGVGRDIPVSPIRDGDS